MEKYTNNQLTDAFYRAQKYYNENINEGGEYGSAYEADLEDYFEENFERFIHEEVKNG